MLELSYTVWVELMLASGPLCPLPPPPPGESSLRGDTILGTLLWCFPLSRASILCVLDHQNLGVFLPLMIMYVGVRSLALYQEFFSPSP